jgi:hypothetical protein
MRCPTPHLLIPSEAQRSRGTTPLPLVLEGHEFIRANAPYPILVILSKRREHNARLERAKDLRSVFLLENLAPEPKINRRSLPTCKTDTERQGSALWTFLEYPQPFVRTQ